MELGNAIQQIRKSKGVRQALLAEGIMSRSNLSRFERGCYYPGYDKLIQLLDKLEMSLDELLFLVNGNRQPLKRTTHLELTEAGNRYDFQKVREISHTCLALFEKTRTAAYYHLYLLGQGLLIQHGVPDRIGKLEAIAALIKPYLIGVDNWYLYEFKLLNNFLFTLTPEDAAFFGQRASAEFERYRSFAESRTVHQHLMQNTAILCMEARDYRNSLFFLQKALPLADKTHLLYDKVITCIYLEITLLCLKQKSETATLLRYLAMLQQLDFLDAYQALLQVCRRHQIIVDTPT